jgi:transmembrane sensor
LPETYIHLFDNRLNNIQSMEMSEEIKKLIEKFIDNSISAEEIEILDNWRKSDIENEKIINEIKAILLLTSINNNYIEPYKKQAWNRLKQKIEEEKSQLNFLQLFRKQKVNVWMQAASIILLIGLGVALGISLISNHTLKIRKELVANDLQIPDTLTINTKPGSRSTVLLPDGSKVWLNNDSEIKFHPDFKNHRKVFLTGEAFFDVAATSEATRFNVYTSDITIEVLGTRFNVKAYPNEGVIETTLEEGEIILYKKDPVKDLTLITLTDNSHATFIKKEGVIFPDQLPGHKNAEDLIEPGRKEELIILEKVDTKKHTSWKDGNLIIQSESFERLSRKLERWYDVKIEIKNEKVKNLHFSANFKNETIEQALEALKIAHPFDYTFEIDKNLITIK